MPTKKQKPANKPPVKPKEEKKTEEPKAPAKAEPKKAKLLMEAEGLTGFSVFKGNGEGCGSLAQGCKL